MAGYILNFLEKLTLVVSNFRSIMVAFTLVGSASVRKRSISQLNGSGDGSYTASVW